MPSAEIVPVVRLPPFTPFTRQTTPGSSPGLTWAKNLRVSPPRTLALAGLTAIAGPALRPVLGVAVVCVLGEESAWRETRAGHTRICVVALCAVSTPNAAAANQAVVRAMTATLIVSA